MQAGHASRCSRSSTSTGTAAATSPTTHLVNWPVTILDPLGTTNTFWTGTVKNAPSTSSFLASTPSLEGTAGQLRSHAEHSRRQLPEESRRCRADPYQEQPDPARSFSETPQSNPGGEDTMMRYQQIRRRGGSARCVLLSTVTGRRAIESVRGANRSALAGLDHRSGKAGIANLRVRGTVQQHNDCTVIEGCVTKAGKHTLLRFNTSTANVGEADLVIGDPVPACRCSTSANAISTTTSKTFADYRLWTLPRLREVGGEAKGWKNGSTLSERRAPGRGTSQR